jgi:crotonobetainyl-CoA:carnitine CoA-transferase CaiB-like acyl-CoA transferase
MGPLAGITVVDLSMWWAGPLTTELFALMGASVIKVEAIQRPDGWRMGIPGPEPQERAHVFNAVNLNKRGITLDLSQPEGRELLRRLVERADALVENYSPRVLANFGLTDDVLFDWRPGLVVLSMPAFGSDGPWGDFVGFAPNIEQLSGLPNFVGYEGGPPVLAGTALADPVAGLAGAFTLLAALHERDRTGQGQHVDLSQLEVLTSLLAAGILETAATSAEPVRRGNAHPAAAPHGVYPCLGDDSWVAIACMDDSDFRCLVAAMMRADLGTDSRFITMDARLRNREELDGIIAAWTRGEDAADVAELLQAVDVAAGQVVDPRQLHDDPHLWERGFFVELDREAVGRHAYPGLPFRFSETPGAVRSPAPTLGQHNREVLGSMLGLSDEDLAALAARQVIGDRPL